MPDYAQLQVFSANAELLQYVFKGFAQPSVKKLHPIMLAR